MNILIVDTQCILSEKQLAYARNRLLCSLLRFSHRINGATMHFSIAKNREQVKCAINVSVEETGIISVKRKGNSSDDVMNLAVNAVETKVAFRVDWRSRFNAETFTTWMSSMSQSLRWLTDFNRQKTLAPTTRASLAKPPTRSGRSDPARLSGPHFGRAPSKRNAFNLVESPKVESRQ